MRPDKDRYYLDIAFEVAQRGTCLRRNYGAVIVKDDQIVGTGYCGAPRGVPNCIDIGVCKRKELNIPAGERYELCRSVHGEANAIIHAGRDKCIGSTIYVAGFVVHDMESGVDAHPCKMCSRMIINAGIEKIVYADNWRIRIKSAEKLKEEM